MYFLEVFVLVSGVYNFMLAFTKASASPTFRTLLKGHTCQAQLYVKRYSISDIPYEDESKCAQWLHELFLEKVSILSFSPHSFIRYSLLRIDSTIILLNMIHSMVLDYQKYLLIEIIPMELFN